MTVANISILSSFVFNGLINLANKILTMFEFSCDQFFKILFRLTGKLALQEGVLLVEDSFLKFYGTDNVLYDRFLVLCFLKPSDALF